MSVIEIIAAFLLIIACIFVIAVVLMQESKQGMSNVLTGGSSDNYYQKNSGRTREAKLAKAIPEARITVAHGKMDKETLEDIWSEMLAGEIDILVCTTIIETGVDIPNANTLIIEDADKMGLSQLHQLRGRVGRSSRRAYAYFTYPKNRVLSDVASKRLSAIRDFTEFGAGFKVAMRDLEIRGAGNLLGTEQSGHMMNIGYELYCKMVDDAVRALQGEIVNENREETSVEIPVSAYIP